MLKSRWLVMPVASLLCCGSIWVADAQAPAQGPSAPLYCRGPLSTFRSDGGRTIRTPFKWAKVAASEANPDAGECAWADRPPQADEGKPGDENAIMGALGPFDAMPVGTYGKICVSLSNKVLVARSVIRGEDSQIAPFHKPPFSKSTAGCPG
jgi:hypothetical protein